MWFHLHALHPSSLFVFEGLGARGKVEALRQMKSTNHLKKILSVVWPRLHRIVAIHVQLHDLLCSFLTDVRVDPPGCKGYNVVHGHGEILADQLGEQVLVGQKVLSRGR